MLSSGRHIQISSERTRPKRSTSAAGSSSAGRTTVAGVGAADDHGLVAIAAPIPAADGTAGVIAATAASLFSVADVPRLETLAAEAGRRLTADASSIRHAG